VIRVAALLQAMLAGGRGLWSAPTLRKATSDQNGHLPGKPWGLGWATDPNDGPAGGFGDLLSGRAFGHTGSVGSLAWAGEAPVISLLTDD
jgi:hypothetical protein